MYGLEIYEEMFTPENMSPLIQKHQNFGISGIQNCLLETSIRMSFSRHYWYCTRNNVVVGVVRKDG